MNTVTIRPLSGDDLPSAKEVIDSTGLFPGEMLGEMAAPCLAGTAPDDLWFVALDEEVVLGLVYAPRNG